MTEDSKLGLAVVTGASSGLGAVYADRLAARGHALVLIARRGKRLEALAKDLLARHGVACRIEVTNLEAPDDLARIETLVRDQPVSVLVNNAGIGALGQTSDQTAGEIASVVKLNVLALSVLSHAALEGFRTRSSGTLVNIGSVIALAPNAAGAAYSGSKAFVLNFTRSLQLEYAASPIRIQLVQPGPIKTEFFEAAGVSEDMFPPESFLSAEQLVDAALAGMDAGEAVTTPSMPDVQSWNGLEERRVAFIASTRSGRVADRYEDWSKAAPPN